MKRYRKMASAGLVLTALFLAIPPNISAQTSTDKTAEKVKADVIRLGSGQRSRVIVETRDGTKLEGTITQILDASFDVTNENTRQTITLIYGDVLKVKKQGRSGGAKTAVKIATVAGIVIVALTLSKSRRLGTICPLGCGPF